MLDTIEQHGRALAVVFMAPAIVAGAISLVVLPVHPAALTATTAWWLLGVAIYILLRAVVGATKKWGLANFAGVGMFVGMAVAPFGARDLEMLSAIAVLISSMTFGFVLFGGAAMIRNAIFPYRS